VPQEQRNRSPARRPSVEYWRRHREQRTSTWSAAAGGRAGGAESCSTGLQSSRSGR
jgi:hypothetical protein